MIRQWRASCSSIRWKATRALPWSASRADGLEAVRLAGALRPDVITMDIQMPRLDGIQATRRIMETHPVPITIVSSQFDPGEAYTSFRALEAGALMILPRPLGPASPGAEESARELIQAVKTIAGVRVLRRRPSSVITSRAAPEATAGRIEVVVVGASTGGPIALQELLGGLPENFRVPMAIVQHIAPGFSEAFIDWLGQSTGKRVTPALPGALLEPGGIYVAPDGCHFGLGPGLRMALSSEPPDAGLRPSVRHLFRSALSLGDRVAAILLTGMGCDGAEELKSLRAGGAITFAQDEESSVVHGMPGEAIRLGAAVHVLPPALIASTLARLVQLQTRTLL